MIFMAHLCLFSLTNFDMLVDVEGYKKVVEDEQNQDEIYWFGKGKLNWDEIAHVEEESNDKYRRKSKERKGDEYF